MNKISILYVSYNSLDLIENSISSLLPFLNGISHEILVWENGSKSILYSSENSRFQFYSGNENYGYGYGLNRLAEKAKGNILLIINPDTKIIKFDINKTVQLFDNTEIGVIGIQHLNVDSEIVSSTRSFPRLRYLFLDMFLFSSIFRKSEIFGRQFMFHKSHQVSFFPEVVVGSLMLLRTNDFKFIKGFDERFFMYCEETDLCRRLFQLGKRAYFYADSILIHDEGGATPNLKFNVINNYVSLNLYSRVHFSKLKSNLFVFMNLLNKLTRGFLYIVFGIISFDKNFIKKGILFLSVGFRNPFKYFKI